VLVGILAARAAQRKPVTKPVIAPASSPPPAKPADVVLVAARGLKHKPVLHLGNAAKAKLPPGAQPT
jgi:Flp pilus assembly protein CpaB